MKRNIYADNAATTKLDEVAFGAMKNYMLNDYGNASQPYSFARTSKKALWRSRDIIADCINSNAEEIFFTSGGTESDNWVIKKFGSTNQKKVIIASEIEHHAVLNSCEEIKDDLHEIIFLPVDKEGVVSTELLIKTLAKYHNLNVQMLVSIMMANNEIGTIEPIEEIGKIAKMNNIIFHTDAVQAIGNIKIDVNKLNIDSLSMSAHKFYGPKGVGALYVKNGIDFKKIQDGGHQEKDKRAGTENVAGIVGLGKAIQIANKNLDKYNERLKILREYLISQIEIKIPDVKINGHRTKRLPGNVNVSFRGIDAGELLLNLDEKGICASAGSACSTGNPNPSHVLTAIGLPSDLSNGALRITLGEENTQEDINYLVESLVEIVKKLRNNKME